MKLDYGPGKNWLNFGSDPEHILDIMKIINLAVGHQQISIQKATKFPMPLLLLHSSSNCK